MKTEPIEAYKHLRSWWFENLGDDYCTTDSANEAIKIAFQEGQSNPKIKQLEWLVSEDTKTMLANIPFNNYYFIDGVDGMIFLTINGQYHIGRYATIDEAKSAAQRDFEKRIKECLD